MNVPDRGSEREEAGRMPSRREFLALGVGALAVAAVPLAGRRAPQLVRRKVPCMGTLAEVGVVHRNERYAHAALDAALAELHRVEAAMTRFRPDSEVGRVNLDAGGGASAVSGETARVVEAALRWAEASGGSFDPSIGRAVALWDVGHRSEPPTDAEVRELAGRRFHRSVEVGRREGRPAIHLHDRDAALDLGGIAKGYGVDRAVAALRDWGITRGLVNVGGDLYALGTSPEGDPWRVGVRDPTDSARLREVLDAEDVAVATSGDYEAFFEHEGIRYHHLLDPATAAPRTTESRSVTVVASDCMRADAATTALFGMEPRTAERVLRQEAPDGRLVGGPSPA